MKYDAILFDFDYTLGDSTDGIFACINYALSRLGYENVDLVRAKKTIGLSLNETFATLTTIKDQKQAALFHKYFKEKSDIVMTKSTIFLPYALDVLRRIKEANLKTGIVTTKYHYRINQILEKFEASLLIDVIVGGDDVKVEKPDPEGLLQAIHFLQIEKSRVLYVGDSLVDAKTAKEAGVSFVAVTTGTTTKEEFKKYPYLKILNSVKDLDIDQI